VATSTLRRRTTRREAHRVTAKSYSPEQARKLLLGYVNHRMGAVHKTAFEFKPGFIYTQVRAISARINQNYDGWPSEDLKKSYRTFIGKPVFVNHQNFDPKKARGKVVAARYIENGNDRYVETVMEIDAKRFPILAHEIISGGMDSVSMGVEAGFTICSYCGNKAVDTPEFCAHVKYHKGEKLPRRNDRTGAIEDVLVYEKCHKLGFFELSYVFDPADETAVVSRVISASNEDGASASHADGKLTLSLDGATETFNAKKAPSHVVVRSGNPGTKSGLSYTQHSSYDAAMKAHKARGEGGHVVEVRQAAATDPSSKTINVGGKDYLVHQPRVDLFGDDAPTPQVHYPYFSTRNGEMFGPSRTTRGQGSGAGRQLYDMAREAFGADHDQLLADYAARQKQAAAAAPPPQDEIWVPEMATPNMPTARRKQGYGEVEAPEDVDTLRGEDEDDDTDEFKHFVESPKELKGPDMDQTKRLDREQESQGLDKNRRVEQVEDIGGQTMASRNARRRQARQRGPSVLVDRTGRRYYAADDEDQEDPSGPPPGGPDDGGGEDPSAGGPPPPPPGGNAGGPPDDGGDDGPQESDEDLIQEAEDDLDQASQAGAGIDPANPGSDAGGTDDDFSDQDDDSDFGDDDGGDDFGGPPGGGDDDPADLFGGDDSGTADHGGVDAGGDEGLPPWLKAEHGGDDAGPPPPHEARRNGNRAVSNRNKRRGGSSMGLSQRGRTATAGRRRHYADDNGYTDGGPYHTDDNDQGEQEQVFISETPGSEAVAAPVPGDGTISNSENNLVASLAKRIQQRNAQQQRDLIAWEQITGARIGSQEANRRYAEAVESPDKVDPTVQTGPAGEELTGKDFETTDLEDVETQPKDASIHAFRAFDSWLKKSTGRTSRQHANRQFIRRQAARWCAASGLSPEALFPTLGTVLREAQRNEGTNRRSNMQRRADESLEIAAPQDRIDVEAPVRDTTDAEAQASQFDLGDFAHNADDQGADPELSVDSQIWAPGEGESSVKKDSNRKADGITAVRYAEAYIEAGLADNTPAEKWKIAGLAQTMRHGTIVDRISVLDAVNSVNRTRFAARRTAGVNRGAPQSLPQGMGGRQMTAGTSHQGSNTTADDSALFLK
jgi:hypothetical protein